MSEIQLCTTETPKDPFFSVELQVTFARPDGSQTTVDGFYDGNRVFRARAYCDTLGDWHWKSASNHQELDGKQGTFRVVKSALPGKLRKHPDDPRQFSFDNGQWFLHLGDTGYRYFASDEIQWQAYIDQAAKLGVTKTRTWFNESRHGVENLFNKDRSGFNLACWQEIDRRITYAYVRHPHVILQLIPFGEDTQELIRYSQGDRVAIAMPRYAQARFSAYPNIQWCISNDREIVDADTPLTGRRIHSTTIGQIGSDMAKREPWKTLLTNHQSRFKGYTFVDALWSDIITLEDLDQVSGHLIAKYRKLGDDPIVLDEDRYEVYRPPADPRYFFRRLMWASLLSGGAATYGGLRTYEPQGHVDDNATTQDYQRYQGLRGYYDAIDQGLLVGGADCFDHVHRFFDRFNLTLVGMTPADLIVEGDRSTRICARVNDDIIIYLPNPSGSDPETDQPATTIPSVTVQLPRGQAPRHGKSVHWFQPATGQWTEGATIDGRKQIFEAPAPGDWVLLLRFQGP